jgi:hypothetical protein
MRLALRLSLLGALGSVLAIQAPARAADPTLSDCIQANEAAIKLRADSKLRQARAQWLVCAAETCNVEIRNACTNRVAEVNKAIPTVVFDAKDREGHDITGVTVTMDGQPLTARLEGTAISLDPGEHRFRFEAVGQAAVERTLVVAEGVKERHETIAFATASAAAPASAPAPAPGSSQAPLAQPSPDATPPTASAVPRAPDSASSGGSGMRTAGLIVGGAGVVGLIVGSVFGAEAFSKWSSAKTDCASAASCNDHAQALSDRDGANGAATASTVAFVLGGVAAATGAALFFFAPAGPRATEGTVGVAPGVGPDGASLFVKGTF